MPKLLSRELLFRGLVPYPVQCGADELFYGSTRDGWRVALSRYRPAQVTKTHPVVLCHGLAANRFAFDLGESVSLARHLRGLGYDVFSLELRGAGLSDRPSVRHQRPARWTFDDYLQLDLPVALRLVTVACGDRAPHFIGHSMGGILLYAHLATGDIPIRSAVTVGSSLDYSCAASDYHRLAGFHGISRWVAGLPTGKLAWVGSFAAGRRDNPIERFQYWPGSTSPEVARRLFAVGFQRVATDVLTQLATAFEPGGLRSQSGQRYGEALSRIRTPVLAIAGDRDRQCPPDAARRTLEQLWGAETRFIEYGPACGHAQHYGHFDLLCGIRAQEEVFPDIAGWLDRHDLDAEPEPCAEAGAEAGAVQQGRVPVHPVS